MSKHASICPAIVMAVVTAGAPISAQADTSAKQLNGRWILPDNKVLVIRGTSWFHPVHGTGTIKQGKGAADYEVFYTAHQGVRCAYSINATAGGEILVLDAVDKTQSPDFCPTGRLSRVSN